MVCAHERNHLRLLGIQPLEVLQGFDGGRLALCASKIMVRPSPPAWRMSS